MGGSVFRHLHISGAQIARDVAWGLEGRILFRSIHTFPPPPTSEEPSCLSGSFPRRHKSLMEIEENEEALLRSVALQNARAVLLARERAEEDLHLAKNDLQ